MTKHQISGKSV